MLLAVAAVAAAAAAAAVIATVDLAPVVHNQAVRDHQIAVDVLDVAGPPTSIDAQTLRRDLSATSVHAWISDKGISKYFLPVRVQVAAGRHNRGRSYLATCRSHDPGFHHRTLVPIACRIDRLVCADTCEKLVSHITATSKSGNIALSEAISGISVVWSGSTLGAERTVGRDDSRGNGPGLSGREGVGLSWTADMAD